MLFTLCVNNDPAAPAAGLWFALHKRDCLILQRQIPKWNPAILERQFHGTESEAMARLLDTDFAARGRSARVDGMTEANVARCRCLETRARKDGAPDRRFYSPEVAPE